MVPASRETAADRLARLLHLIPLASREGGRRLDELAEALGVTTDRVLRDIEEATARAFYHPAGGGDDLQILIEGDRVHVYTTGEFRRPVRLSPLEALALALGFRVLAAEREPARRAELLARAARLESALATAPPEELVDRFVVGGWDRGEDGTAARVREAARDRRCCRIEYLKPDAAAPETRVIHPWALLRAGGAWYVVAYCTRRNGTRVFRGDRILAAEPLSERFEPPEDFDPDDWIAPGGRVYRPGEEVEVVVRYSPRIARWIREKGPVEEREDGSVIVRHRVADPGWAVRHVLQYGPDAQILEPASLRRRVAEAAGRMAAGAGRVAAGPG